MRVAVFRSLPYDFEGVEEADHEDMDDYVRITEYVDIQFTELSAEEVVPASIEKYNKMKASVDEQHLKAVATIDEKIALLRAITHQPEESE